MTIIHSNIGMSYKSLMRKDEHSLVNLLASMEGRAPTPADYAEGYRIHRRGLAERILEVHATLPRRGAGE